MMTDIDTTTATTKPARARRAKALTLGPVAPAPVPTSKTDTVIKLLLRAKGATPVELIAATDWQPHSLRAFLSSLRKKGRSIVREERKGGAFAYRIATPPALAAITAGSEAVADASDTAPNDTAEA